MSKDELIRSALRGERPDRVPVSTWMHFSEVDQDPRALAETQWNFNQEFDFDFIKLMPFGAYTVQDWGAKLKIYCDPYKEPIIEDYAIHQPSDWLTIEALPAIFGTWGKQLQLARWIGKLSRGQVPYVQTIFSPLTIARKLAGERLVEDLRTHPKEVHAALQAITETNLNFIKANIEAGVSGFFFATQVASADVLPLDLYQDFAKPYDLQVIQSYVEHTYFNIIHLHGGNIYFEEAASLPVKCLNWHDRHTKPSLREARKLSEKCFLGGIQEVPSFVGRELKYDSFLGTHRSDEVVGHVREAIEMVEGRGIIVGPGCVIDPRTSKSSLHAIRQAVDDWNSQRAISLPA